MTRAAAAFGERLARTLGSGPSRSSLAMQQASFAVAAHKALRQRRQWRRAQPWVLAIAAALTMVLITLGVTRWMRGEALDRGTAAAHATVISTSALRAETLSLIDGSVIIVAPNSLAEIRREDPNQAEVALSHGRLDLNVTKRQHAHFTVAAGGYRVVVVGTRFEVDLDEATQRLRVSVSEGRVKVFGKGLPRGGTAVAAGSRVELSTAGSRLSARAPAPQPEPPDDPSRATDMETARTKLPRRPEPTPPVASAREATWREQAQSGRYREAYALAEKQGFDGLVASLPAGDLLVLANAARYAGHPTDARRAFLELRARFGRHPASVLASFYLARLALDNDHDPRSAARWFRTYLAEAPDGQLAAGARVDLMNLLLQLGDQAGAKTAARDYLKHHPKGAYAATARSLLGDATSP